MVMTIPIAPAKLLPFGFRWSAFSPARHQLAFAQAVAMVFQLMAIRPGTIHGGTVSLSGRPSACDRLKFVEDGSNQANLFIEEVILIPLR